MPVHRKSKTTPRILWTPASGITYSAMTTFLECREQFRLAYVEGWSRKEFSDAIEFGSIFHHFCEHYNFNTSTPSADIANIRQSYLKHLRRQHITPDTKRLDLLDKAEVVFRCYTRHQQNQHFIWVSREQHFNVPIDLDNISTLNFSLSGKPISLHHPIFVPPSSSRKAGSVGGINLRGKRDGIFVYPDNPDEFWIFETKTKSIIDESGLVDSLGHDMQLLLYAYATQQELKAAISPSRSSKSSPPLPVSKTNPGRIAGAIYNVVRNPKSYQGKKETSAEFLQRLEKLIDDDPGYYFYRQEITFAKGDLDAWANVTLKPILFQLLQWWDALTTDPSSALQPYTPLHFMNPNALYNKYGRCHMFDLIVNNNKFLYEQRLHVFPELAA